jgi:hypothetical protein
MSMDLTVWINVTRSGMQGRCAERTVREMGMP